MAERNLTASTPFCNFCPGVLHETISRREEKTMNEQMNIINQYADPVEERQIRHFACKEMSRQIHRYIKGMSGSKEQMMRVEEKLEKLSLEEKEKAIALYFDLNRKALKGLDFKMVLVRAVANYADTFDYFLTLVNDRRRMVGYLKMIRECYIQQHQVVERNGKFGIIDHRGNVILSPKYEFLRTCYVYVDDLRTMPIIAQLEGKMGLVLPDGKDTPVTPFKYDSIALRESPPYFEARCGNKEILLTTDGEEKPKP